MKEIPLSGVRGSELCAKVDDDDWKLVKDYSWYLSSCGYAYSENRVNKIRIRRIMHRIIMKVSDPKIDVDHKNMDKLDNRKNNLRLCTRSQNMANGENYNTNNITSKYRGVSLYRNGKKWKAKITYNYKQYHLGLFSSEIEAAKAYNEAAVKYFGEFARINKA